jgi:hypothetical protein
MALIVLAVATVPAVPALARVVTAALVPIAVAVAIYLLMMIKIKIVAKLPW